MRIYKDALKCVYIFIYLLFIIMPIKTYAMEQYPIVEDSPYEPVIGYGRSINGSVYVPLRLLFEATSAKVEYRPDDRLITIKRADGAVLTMHPGDKQAQLTHLGDSQTIAMPAATRLISGTTYVPIRFAADNLMCAVEWDNTAKKVRIRRDFVLGWPEGTNNRYTLDVGTEQVYETATDGTTRLLGKISGLQAVYDWQYNWQITQVKRNLQGSYIISLMGTAMDSPFFPSLTVLLTADGKLNRVSKQTSAIFSEDSIWWPDVGKVQQLEVASGEVLAEYNYQEILAAAMPQAHDFGFIFAEDEYLLLSYQQEANWFLDLPVLVHLPSGEVTDLFSELIPAAERGDFFYDGAVIGSSLAFVKAADGLLYFSCWRWNEEHTQREAKLLTYRYK